MLVRLIVVVLLGGLLGQEGSVNPKLLTQPTPSVQLPVKDLRVTSSVITEVPSFGFFGMPECDKDGEVFFHLHKGSLNNMEVLKLKFVAGSAEPTTYRAPNDFTGKEDSGFFINFSVTPSGEFWMLGESRVREYFLFKFDSDGTPISKTKLAIPEHMDLIDFAVSDQGIVLVSGNFRQEANADLVGKRYIALLNTAGKIQKEFDPKADKVDLGAMNLHEGGAVYGDDGLLYVLMPEQIVVISQSGTLVRRLTFDKPKEFFAVHLAVSAGYVAIWLQKDSEDGPLITQFLILDTDKGEAIARYSTTPETGNTGLCFSRKDGFTMWRTENQRLKLLTANAN